MPVPLEVNGCEPLGGSSGKAASSCNLCAIFPTPFPFSVDIGNPNTCFLQEIASQVSIFLVTQC